MTALEQIDVILKRADLSYDEAKSVLNSFNGDLLEALIYLEKNGKIKPAAQNKGEQTVLIQKESFCDSFSAFVKKAGNKCGNFLNNFGNSLGAQKPENKNSSIFNTLLILLAVFTFNALFVVLIIKLC